MRKSSSKFSAGEDQSAVLEAVRPEDRRSRILRAAALRIARSGFEAASIRHIADDVNIQSSSLYHHFSGKDEILYEIVKDGALLMRDETMRIVFSEKDSETKLVALVIRQLGEFVQNPVVHTILYNERRILRNRVEFLDIRNAKQAAYNAWLDLLEAGKRNRQFDDALDPYQTIRTITRMLSSAGGWFSNDDETVSRVVKQYSYDQVEEFHLRFILGAVRNRARACDVVPVAEGRNLAYP